MPSNRKKRYESMLFNYETTGRTDYRDGRIRPTVTTLYKGKSTCVRIRPPPLKDTHALTDWYKPIVPFDLMHKPKEVVRTNPRVPQKPYSEPKDEFRAQAQATRPRLVMTPAVSVDDIEPKPRQVLVEDLYKSTVMKMNQEAGIKLGGSLRAPLPDAYAPANPITLQKLLPPFVSPEWRMETARWDGRQPRAHCEPTKEFWLGFKLPECRACDDTAIITSHRKRLRERK